MPDTSLPPIISRTLATFASGERRIMLLRGVGEAVLVQVVGVGVVAAIDALVHPSAGWHLFLSGSIYAVTGAVLVGRVLVPLMRKQSSAAIALQLEKRAHGQLDEQLSSAVELSTRPDPGVSQWMIERTIALAAQRAAQIQVPTLIDTLPARRMWKRSAVVVGLLVAACAIPGVPNYVARAMVPTMIRPAIVQLQVLPGDQQLAVGAAFDVHVTASPDPGSARMVLSWDDGVDEIIEFPVTQTENKAAGKYNVRLPAVTSGFSYRILAGDGESRSYRVSVAKPPVLGDVTLHVTPPIYSGLPARTIEGGDADILAGSSVSLIAQLNGEQAVSGAVVFDGGEQAAHVEENQLSILLKPQNTMAYGVRLIGKDGLVAEPVQRWILSVRPDAPPVVSLSAKGLEAGMIGSDEAVLCEVKLLDDLGIQSAELVVSIDGKERFARPLALPKTTAGDIIIPTPVDIEALGLGAGAELSVHIRAVDVGGQRAQSEPLSLVVASTADARGAAQAARLRQALADIDAQIESMRGIARQWSGLIRAVDPASKKGELALLANRIDVWRNAVTVISDQLIEEGGDGRVETAANLMALAHELHGWSRGAGYMLQNTNNLVQLAQGNKNKLLRQGRDLSDGVLIDLQSMRKDLTLIIARLESAAVAARVEAAHARYQRALPIARGERGWRGEEGRWRSGLAGEFFKGREFKDGVKHSEVGLPNWRDRDIPNIGREHFCARYVGEIYIPKKGKYTFHVSGNDGIRFSMHGKNVIPNEAWRDQSYNTYSAELDLQEGWHPIVLEMYQSGGNSGLELAFGPYKKKIRPVTDTDVRSATRSGVDPFLVQAMASLPSAQVDAAHKRMVNALTEIADIPKKIGDLAALSGSDELRRIARTKEDDGRRLAETIPSLADWSINDLSAADHRADQLTRITTQANHVVTSLVTRGLRDRVKPGQLAVLRQSIERIRDHQKRLQDTPNDLSDTDKTARWRMETTICTEWIAFIGIEAEYLRRVFIDEARRSGATLGSRSAAVHVARRLDLVSERVEEALRQLENLPEHHQQAANKINEQANRIAEALHEAEHWERVEQGQRLGEMAEPLAVTSRSIENQMKDDMMTAQVRWRMVRPQVEELTRQARSGSHTDQAKRIENEMPVTLGNDQLNELTKRLEELARVNDAWHGGLDRLVVSQLQTSASDLDKDIDNVNRLFETATDLSEARLAEALEGERHLQENRQDMAAGFAVLSRDIGAVLDNNTKPTPVMVRKFAERAAILAGMVNDDVRKKLLADAEKEEKKTNEADQLDALAAALKEAVHKKENREELQAQLAKLAEDVLAENAAAERAELAKDLDALQQEQDILSQAEQAARQRFAAAETKVAEALHDIAKKAQAAADEKAPPALAKALEKAAEQAPKSAEESSALAKAAQTDEPYKAARAINEPADQAANDPQGDPEAVAQNSPTENNTSDQANNSPTSLPDKTAPDTQAEQGSDNNKPASDTPETQAVANNDKNSDSQKAAGDTEQQAESSPEESAQAQAAAEKLAAQDRAAAAKAASEAKAPSDSNADNTEKASTNNDAAAKPSATLVAEAHKAADKLDREVVQPLAQEFQDAIGQEKNFSDAAKQQAAEVGRALAEAVAQQREAAEQLAAVLEQQAASRDALAESVAQAESSATPMNNATSKEMAQAQRAQEAANRAQSQADRQQAQADKAQSQAEAAAAQAQNNNSNPQAAAQAQQAAQQAAQAQAQAIAAQAQALQAQQAALANGPISPEMIAEAVSNFSQAERNSLDALDNTTPIANPAAAAETAAQAGNNLERAAAAREALQAQLQQAAQAMQAQLAAASPAASASAQSAPSPASLTQEPTQESTQGQASSQAPSAASQSPAAQSPAAMAAAEALAAIAAAPSKSDSYAQAAQSMAAAASEARLASQMGQPSPMGSPGSESKAGSGDPGNADGMRNAPPGVDQAAWARAQQARTGDVTTTGVERFSEEHQEAIRAYLRRVGAK